MSPRWHTIAVDGAMGTTLRGLGLARNEPADLWVERHPDRVLAVHRAFVKAGCRILRTATLCSRPDAVPEHAARCAAAVALAREAGPGEVWLSLGPLGPGRGSLEGLQAALDAGADRVLLETFVDPDELLQAVAHLAARGARVAASLVPGPGGLLAGGRYPVEALRQAGADVLGLNCGTDSTHALRAWTEAHDDGPWFVAPAGGDGLGAVWRALHGRVRYLGGCCGVDPLTWEATWPG